jgi:predicted glycosyltransferase
MKFTFLTNTPAHVHLYKHAVRRLRERGHEVLVLARDYGCTTALLDYYDLPHEVYGSCGTAKSSLFLQLPGHYWNVFRAVRRFDPDLLFGMGGYAAHAGFVTRTPVVLILDSEPTSLDHLVSRPFARAILTPHAFRKDLGANHYEFTGFKETAYLHPDVFEPSGNVRERLGVGPDEPYVLARFNAFGSHHDIGEGGFSPAQRREFVERLAADATVFVSDEGGDFDFEDSPGRPFDLHPALLHDALAAADLLVADSQTTVTEAALLGTPAIRSNSWVGDDDMGNFRELEAQGLVHNIAAFDEVLDTALDLLTDPDANERWQRRRTEYLAEQVNLTDLIVDVAEALGDVGAFERVTARSVTGGAG